MDERTRRRVLDYVKPLAVGLDGVTNYGDVERVLAAANAISDSRHDLDRDLLFLLAVFSGQERWVSRMGHASRTEIFLGSLGVPAPTIRRLFRGLSRFAETPALPEEEITHDAVALERLGAYGIVRSLVEGHRERMDFLEMAAAIEAAASVPLRTEAGDRLAEPRRLAMREFARRLREEHAQFAG